MTTEAEQEAPEISAEEVQEARGMGWAEKEHWRGKPEEWLDARAFLDKGRELMPVLRANNRDLLTRQEALRAEVAGLRETLRAQQASMALLEESREADIKAAREETLAQLKEQLAEASRDGDHDKIAELTTQIAQVPAVEPEKKAAVQQPQEQTVLPADIQAWFRAHPKFMNEPEYVGLSNGIAAKMRGDPANAGLQGIPFLEKVAAEVTRILEPAAAHSKVEGSGGGGEHRARSQGNGMSYSDLPAEAKAVCDRQASKYVGEGRAHKTVASWQASYARKYFEQERKFG